MSITRPMTRSPLAVARQAVATAERSRPAYSSARSRHDFPQPQLFAALTLEPFVRTDYRGIVAILADSSDLRAAVRLARVPHFSALAYAAQRLLKTGGSRPPRPSCLRTPPTAG